MFPRASIRLRLIAFVTVPALALLGFVGLRLSSALADAAATRDIGPLTAFASAERLVLHALQVERTRSLEHLVSLGAGEGGTPEVLADVRGQVGRAAATAVDPRTTLSDLQPVLDAQARARDAIAGLAELRAAIDDGSATGADVLAGFDPSIATLLSIDEAIIRAVEVPAVTQRLRAGQAVSRVVEATLRAADATLLAAADDVDPADAEAALLTAEVAQGTWLQVLDGLTSPAEVAQVRDAAARARAAALPEGSGDVDAGEAMVMADQTLGATATLFPLEERFADQAVAAAETAHADARQEVLTLIGIAIATALAGLLLLMMLTRIVVSPLRRLTAIADHSSALLPVDVERVADGGEPTVSPFDDEVVAALVDRGDELGDLARAMRLSASTALDVAASQARTRAGVAQTIADVARREQSLVERQLDLLDALEDREESAEQLAELFKLDHLATRMRRNAENLLLLSAAKLPGELTDEPQPVVDVVRAAAAEIEDYARVDVRVAIPRRIVGRAATPLSHLLAELIENAARFSPPHTRVDVGAQELDSGILVTIRDRGIGITAEDLVAVHERLEQPPLLDAAESRRLGLYVVALIAQRLDVGVRLSPRADGDAGLQADVHIPAALIDDGTEWHGWPAAATHLAEAARDATDAREGRTGGATTPGSLAADEAVLLAVEDVLRSQPSAPIASASGAALPTRAAATAPVEPPAGPAAEAAWSVGEALGGWDGAAASTTPPIMEPVPELPPRPPTATRLPTRDAGAAPADDDAAAGLSMAAASGGTASFQPDSLAALLSGINGPGGLDSLLDDDEGSS